MRLIRVNKDDNKDLEIKKDSNEGPEVNKDNDEAPKSNKDNDEVPKLEDFTFCMEDRPSYVIFSHRWLSYEKYRGDVTFKEFNDSENKIKQAAAIKDSKDREEKLKELGLRPTAFNKLIQAINLAKEHQATHIWVDSCCINRDSSSELTEELNSMYQHYKDATKCLVYLHDFEGHAEEPDFSKTDWFKRGWTLQELIAPKEVVFYNKNWNILGKRSQTAVAKAISKVTKIPIEVLNGKKQPYQCSVAQRMSWAADRKTLRGEDMSYSLFGLFDVNLTPIYGEGAQKAFLRLQEAIMSSTNDMSVFAWKSKDNNEEYRGALARSPDEFSEAGGLVHESFLGPNPEFSMTNRGLKIMPLIAKNKNGVGYFLPLNCADAEKDPNQSLGIIISKQDESDEQLYRYEPQKLYPFNYTIFKKDYEFWLKQNEKPIYIARNERYLKSLSEQKSSSSKSSGKNIERSSRNTKKARSMAGPKKHHRTFSSASEN